jgi:hypothetical protein
VLASRAVSPLSPSVALLFAALLAGCESPEAAPPSAASAKASALPSEKPKAPPQLAPTGAPSQVGLPPLPSALVLPPAEGKEALGLPDPSHADPLKLSAKARELAKRVEPTAVLVAMVASPVSRGTVNLGTLGGYVQWTFEWKSAAAKGAKTKGKEGNVVISATASGIGAADPGPAALALTTAESLGIEAGLADPKCQLVDGWGKLRAAGLPDDTSATVRLTADAGTGKAMYIVSVEGRPELTRRLDAISCDVEGPTRLSVPSTSPVLVSP